jgi:hypothetical protein
LFCIALFAPAYGANLSLVVTPKGYVFDIETSPKDKIALFERYNDIWLVSAALGSITTNIPDILLENVGIERISPLRVENGSGVHISFVSPPENTLWSWNGILIEQKETSTLNTSGHVALSDGVILPKSLTDTILLAKHDLTGDSYPVVAFDTVTPTLSPQNFGKITAVPTRTGMAFISDVGGVLSLPKEKGGLKISLSASNTAPTLSAVPSPEVNGISATTTSLFEALNEAVTEPSSKTSFIAQTRPAEFSDAMSGVAAAISKAESISLPETKSLTALLTQMGVLQDPALSEAEAKDTPLPDPPTSDPFFDKQFTLPEGSGLFPRIEVEDILAYNEASLPLTEKFLNSSSDLQRDQNRIEIARLNVNYSRLTEALDIMQSVPKFEENGYPKSTTTRIMLGALLAIAGRTDAAEELLSIEGEPETERKLWLGYTKEKQRKYHEAQDLMRENIDISLGYPFSLQKELRLSLARALLKEEQISIMQDQIDTLISILGEEDLPAEADLLVAKAALLKGDRGQAEALLAEVANSPDKEFAIDAQYEYLMLLYSRGDIARAQAIDALKELRFMWRGGEVEEQVLYKLGRMLVAAERYREGLDQLKFFNIFFPESQYRTEITALMSETFMGLLQQDGSSGNLDTIATLGLYYDFRELTPPGEQGDMLITYVAMKLKSIGLHNRAIELLENQYRYRAEGNKERQARLAYTIAESYYGQEDYPSALFILKETKAYPMDKDLHYKRTLLDAKIAFAEKRHADAIAALEEYKTRKEARITLSNVVWDSNDFDKFMEFVEPQFVSSSPFESWTPEDRVNFKRLAFIYNNKGQIRNLEGLRNKYINKLVNPYDQRYFEILLKDKGSVIKPMEKTEEDASILDTVITQMENYNEFARSYNLIKRSRDSEKRQRYLFNQSRGQLTAPPKL